MNRTTYFVSWAFFVNVFASCQAGEFPPRAMAEASASGQMDRTHIGQDLAPPFYVSASRLVVRDSPSAGSKIRGYLPTNSTVSVKSWTNDWCEVTGQFTGSSDLQFGYVACSYLAKRKLRLEELKKQGTDATLTGKERLDLLQKEFWISPSPDTLLRYGDALDKEHPQPEAIDLPPKKTRRQEFEAMKNFMRAGWSPAVFEYQPIDTKLEPATHRLLPLPQVKQSLFGATPPHLVLAPYIGKKWLGYANLDTVFMADTRQLVREVLSRQSVKLVRVTSISGPLAGHYGGFSASWDVGGLSLKFGPPGVPVAAIPANGTNYRNSIVGVSTEDIQFDAECDQIGETITLEKPISKADAARGTLAFIANPEEVGVTSVKLIARKTKALSEMDALEWHRTIAGDDTHFENGYPFTGYRAFTEVFDLNDDAIPDIAFSGFEGSPDSNHLATGPEIDREFIVFLNMGGMWVRHSSFSPLQCAS